VHCTVRGPKAEEILERGLKVNRRVYAKIKFSDRGGGIGDIGRCVYVYRVYGFRKFSEVLF